MFDEHQMPAKPKPALAPHLQEREGMNILLTSLTFPEALPMLQPQLSLELDCPPPPDIQIATTQYIYPQTGSAPPQPGLPADVIVFGILIVLAGISRLIPLIYQAKNE